MRVFDLHSDTIGRQDMADWPQWSSMIAEELERGLDTSGTLVRNGGAMDLERMSAFSWCQCFGIWMQDDDAEAGLRFYRVARDGFKGDLSTYSDMVTQVRSMDDVDRALAEGKTAAMLTIENGGLIGIGLDVIDELVADGVMMTSLTWNGPNALASGNWTENGISDLGRDAVRALEDAGIVLDVSHLNDAGLDDLLKIARRPFVASHSNARAVANVPRNLTDDQFRAICAQGGIVGINFFRNFLVERDAPEQGEVTFDELAAHVEHFLDLGGEDALALDSDYDGSDVPEWLESCSDVADLNVRLAGRFGQDLVDKMFFTNAYDFFRRYEASA